MALPSRTMEAFLSAVDGRHASSPPVLALLHGGLNRPSVAAVRTDRFDEIVMELRTIGDTTADGLDAVLAEVRRAMVALGAGKSGLAASHLSYVEDQVPLLSHRARRAAAIARMELLDDLGGEAA